MVSLINDATITSSFNERFIGKTGSIIDIDSSREGNFSKDELLNILQSLNNSSKKKFFESITDELLESFEPEWEKK